MNAATREFVRRRAGNCCEYCRIPQEATPFIPFHVEHIVAKQHAVVDVDDPSGTNLRYLEGTFFGRFYGLDPEWIAAISRWSSAANTTGTRVRKPSILKGSQRVRL